MSLEIPWGTFLRCSGCKPALPSQNQEVIVPSRSIRRFLAGYVQSQRPSGYPQPQLRGHPIPWTGKQAIKAPPPQSPTKFHISHLINPNNWTCPPAIILSDPRFHGSPAILFHKARKAGGGVPHYRMAKDQVHSNIRPGPLPNRNSQEKSCIKSR